jgi:hypothetical protein
MGWVLVAIVFLIVTFMGIYSLLKVSSDCDDQLYGDDQYNED